MHSFTVNASASDSLTAARTASYSITPIPPSITALTQSATTWRAGSSVAHMSRKVHFAGRLSRSKLKPGHYTLTIIATNASGQHVSSRSLSFTTVK